MVSFANPRWRKSGRIESKKSAVQSVKNHRTMKLSALLLAILAAASPVAAVESNGRIAQIEQQQPLQSWRGLKHKKPDGTDTDDATPPAPVDEEKPANDAAVATAVDEAAAPAEGWYFSAYDLFICKLVCSHLLFLLSYHKPPVHLTEPANEEDAGEDADDGDEEG
jgi:hypothetical protein